jgi:predicted signal transduction protein with EAL and GGDEF domain
VEVRLRRPGTSVVWCERAAGSSVDERDAVHAQGCRLRQGYPFSRPLPAQDVRGARGLDSTPPSLAAAV